MTLLELAPVRDGIDRPRGVHQRAPELPRSPLIVRLRHPDVLIVIGLILASAIVRCWNVFQYPGLADDEGTYVAQAQAVRWGELAHYTYWYDHPPLGWIQLAALDWIPQHLLPGVEPVAASRLIAVLAAVVSTVLIYPLAMRAGTSRGVAALGALFAALSPLAVTLQRQVYLDTIAVGWAIVAFLLAYDPRRRLWAHVGAGLCFGVAVLTKETIAVLLPALLWAVLQHAERRTRLFSAIGMVGSFCLPAVVAAAHTGNRAYLLTMANRTQGDFKLLPTEAASPAVQPGALYELSAWYRSTSAANNLTVFAHTASGWGYWTDLVTLPAVAAWTKVTVRTPAVAAGVDAIAWGISLSDNGTLVTDDYSTIKVATPGEPTGTAATGEWNVLTQAMPLRAMHATVLRTGKVLLIAGSGNSTDNFAAGSFRACGPGDAM